MGGERGPQVQLKGSGMCALFGKPYQDVYLSFVSGLLDFSLTWVFDNIDNIAQVLTVFELVNFVFTIYHVFFLFGSFNGEYCTGAITVFKLKNLVFTIHQYFFF